MRFIEINGTYYNSESIDSFNFTQGHSLHIDLKNGDRITVRGADAQYWTNTWTSTYHVVQIIPCVTHLWLVWESGDGAYYAECAHYLALCANGEIQGLSITHGQISIEDNSTCIGMYHESELSVFKNLERYDDTRHDRASD